MSASIEVPRTERCSTCGGTGAKPGTEPTVCPRCRGAGEVQNVRASGFARFISVETCGTCGGRGRVISQPCQGCRGRGVERRRRSISVNVPAGVDDGFGLRLRGQGDASPNGGPPGDLYVVTHILPHPLFKRDGDTIALEREINFPDAALGCELKVPTLNGDALVEIPPGTQSGTVFRLKGRGLPRVDAYGRGDELVQVRIATPTKLTSRQKELLRELAQEFQGDDRTRKGFLKR